MVFYKRLYGIPANLIFLIFTLGSLPPIARNVADNPTASILIVLMVIMFAVVGTLGWRWTLRRRTPRAVYAYLTFQLFLFFVIFIVENAASGRGASSAALAFILVLQSSVIQWKWRWLVYGIVCFGTAILSLPFIPLLNIIWGMTSGLITFGGVLLIGHLIVSEEHARLAADEANRKLAEYALQIEELATANERNRLARDIHDNLGHYLSAVNMQIEAAIAIINTDPERASGTLRKAQTLAKDGLSDIRRSVAVLRTAPTEERPLHEALIRLVEESGAGGLKIDYRVDGQIRPCPADVEMALYRIAQEGLTNIRKHAAATLAQLELSYQETGGVRLKVQDNGQGGKVEEGGGFGLLGIRERVKLLGGTVQIQTAHGQGFSLLVELPA